MMMIITPRATEDQKRSSELSPWKEEREMLHKESRKFTFKSLMKDTSVVSIAQERWERRRIIRRRARPNPQDEGEAQQLCHFASIINYFCMPLAFN
jgi:hypothetical protein